MSGKCHFGVIGVIWVKPANRIARIGVIGVIWRCSCRCHLEEAFLTNSFPTNPNTPKPQKPNYSIKLV